MFAKLTGRESWLDTIVFAGFVMFIGCSTPRESQKSNNEYRGRELFDGPGLSGFYTWLVDTGYHDPRQVFTVTNDVLRISGDGLGYLATKESHADYRLIVEYRWGDANTKWGDRIGRARDSGIFLHAAGPDGNSHDADGAFMAAIECNVFEGATGDFLLIRGDDADGNLIAPRITTSVSEERDADGWPWWKAEGRSMTIEKWGRVNWKNKDRDWKDETGFRGRGDVERPVGEWNRLEIVCRENEIEIFLNGALVNRATDVYPREGKILIQCEGSEFFIRRIELIDLPRQKSGAHHESSNSFDGPYKLPLLVGEGGTFRNSLPVSAGLGQSMP